MPMTAQERVKKYQEKCDAIMLRPKKDEGQLIREAAAEAGQSVQAWVLSCCREKIERG